MNSRSIRTPILALAAFSLAGAMAPAQQPASPTPPAATAAPAPVERRPPAGARMQGRPGMQGQPEMRAGMMQHQRGGPSNFHGAAMMHKRGGFGGPRGGEMGEGFRMGPGGMWWKNPAIVTKLTLTPDQVKRMDGIFQQSRLQLIDLKANVEKQEVMLEPLLSANPPDTAKAITQIDKVADARADLEKANAKMLLSIRGVLTADQWTKLHEGRGPGGAGAPGAAGAQNGQSGPGGGYGGGFGGGRGGGYGGASGGGASEFVAPEPQP
jgi:Spy/CpxP family protein refolding chaperone